MDLKCVRWAKLGLFSRIPFPAHSWGGVGEGWTQSCILREIWKAEVKPRPCSCGRLSTPLVHPWHQGPHGPFRSCQTYWVSSWAVQPGCPAASTPFLCGDAWNQWKINAGSSLFSASQLGWFRLHFVHELPNYTHFFLPDYTACELGPPVSDKHQGHKDCLAPTLV